MISGQMPFKGDYEQAVIYSIQNEEPEPFKPGMFGQIAIKKSRQGAYITVDFLKDFFPRGVVNQIRLSNHRAMSFNRFKEFSAITWVVEIPVRLKQRIFGSTSYFQKRCASITTSTLQL